MNKIFNNDNAALKKSFARFDYNLKEFMICFLLNKNR